MKPAANSISFCKEAFAVAAASEYSEHCSQFGHGCKHKNYSFLILLAIFSAAKELIGGKYKGPFYTTMLLISVYICDGKLSAWTHFFLA